MSEWKEVPLGELYSFRSGLSKPRSAFGSGHGFLSFKDVFYNYFVPEDLTELVESTEHEREACSVLRGDVFLTRTSETIDELGMSCVALKDYPDATFNGFTKRLRPKRDAEIVPEYASYYFRSPRFRRDVTAMASLSTRASLNNEMLERLTMLVPGVDEQEKIGRILKSLDNKIELNRRMNRTLEAIARAIFKSWFVDFDPVRAIAEGREPIGMDSETAAHFPDSFQDSPLGKIPTGWEVAEIGDVCEVVNGGTPSTKVPEYWQPADIAWATPTDITSLDSPVISSTARQISRAGLDNSSARLLPSGSVLVTSRATIGYSAISRVPIATNQGFKSLVCGHRVSSHLMLHVVRWLKPELLKLASGSTYPEINASTFRRISFVLPPLALVTEFEAIAGKLFQAICRNDAARASLAETRDSLLPRLLSGEIQVAG